MGEVMRFAGKVIWMDKTRRDSKRRSTMPGRCRNRMLLSLLSRAVALAGGFWRQAHGVLAASVVACGCFSFAGCAVPSFSVGPYLQSVTESSIIVCWESDVPSDGTVEYWVEGSQSSFILTVASDQRHEVRLENLQPWTAYRYRVRIPSEGEGTFFTAGFRTAPEGEGRIIFAVYGDSRERDEADRGHRSVAEAIRGLDPQFVVHTGDLVSRGDSAYHWGLFWATVTPPDGEASLTGNAPFYPVIGNHEYMSTSGQYKNEAILPYQSYFVLPPNGLEGEHPEWSERFYSFRYGPIFFIVLDVNKDSDPAYDVHCGPAEGAPEIHPGSPQHEWLVNQLKAAREQCPFTFVSIHSSPYSSGPWGKYYSYKLRFLDPLFREYGVDAVFSSHDHFYERCETYVDGYRLLYFVEGAGGASTYSREPGWDSPGSWMWDDVNETHYTKAFDNSSFSFICAEIEPLGNGMWQATFSATRPNGEVFDMVQIRRPWGYIGFGEGLTLSFHSTPGRSYQVEYSNDLPGNGMRWLPLGQPIVAEEPFILLTDDGTETGTSPTDDSVRHRFYRACELP